MIFFLGALAPMPGDIVRSPIQARGYEELTSVPNERTNHPSKPMRMTKNWIAGASLTKATPTFNKELSR